jgi:uncharacterized protein
MFHFKVKILPSNLHGLGLFADEDIPKGKIVYTINPELDLILSNDKYSRLSDDEKYTIRNYGYYNQKKEQWHLSFDDIRFCNHSPNGNITRKERNLISKRNIKKGEEITQNYEEFESLRKEILN